MKFKSFDMRKPLEQILDIPLSSSISDQMRAEMEKSGIAVPSGPLVADGEIHRFYASGRKKSKLNGWYVLSEAKHCGAFGDWATDTKVFFRASFSRELSPAEQSRLDSYREEIEAKEREARRKRQEEVALECQRIWDSLPLADPDHPYLKAKGIRKDCGFRQSDRNLVVPVFDENWSISSLQYISPKGDKHFKTAGRIKGCCWWIGNGTPSFMAEGPATAAAIYQETGRTCIVAFNADNMVAIAPRFRDVTIVADHDDNGKGESCAQKTGNRYQLVPRINEGDTDADDYMLSGGNLCQLLNVEKEHRTFKALKEVVLNPVPQRWLVDNIIPRTASLGMLFGKSGSTKSYLAISLMLCVATGQSEWFGRKVKPGRVLYLCGEGHHAAYERMACWLQQYGILDIPCTMYIAEDTFDLDTEDGESKLIAALEKEISGFCPDLVVVDTLNLYMASDENSTQESTMFIKALRRLASRFSCSIMLVHHTGVTEQDRARGSSVFLGAMDYQIKVSKTETGEYKFEHTKNKAGVEQEPIFYILEKHEVEGWLDEEGHNVTNAIPVRIEKTVTEKEERRLQHEDENALISALGQYGQCSDLEGLYIRRRDFTEFFRSLSESATSTLCYDRTNPNPSKSKRSKSVVARLMEDGSIEYDTSNDSFYVTGPQLIEKVKASRVCAVHFQALGIDIRQFRHPVSTVGE